MSERRERIGEALRVCAEAGVPETAVPWPEIRERTLTGPGRLSRERRFVPRTRAGWVFATAMIVLFSMGAYAAGGLLYAIFQDELPGGEAMELSRKLDLSQTANGMRVSLEWAYADQNSVVVGYGVEELEEDRRAFGYPTRLEPSLDRKTVLTTGIGSRRWNAEDVGWAGSDEDVPVVAVFETREGLETGRRERFRLTIPIGARIMVPTETTGPEASGTPDEDLPYQVETGAPFVFDFEIPIQKAPTIDVQQSVEANGVTLTLDRVVDSPGRPKAVFCYESPDTRYDWEILGERDSFYGGGPQIGKGQACGPALLDDALDGRSSVTVSRLQGIPDCPPGDDNGCTIPRGRLKTIEGPWTFEFEVPER